MNYQNMHFRAAPTIAALTLLLAFSAGAQGQDPTRPAPQWLAAQPRAPGSEPPPDTRTPDVQIIVIGPSRKFVIVNGEPVYAGETYNGARLVKLDQTGVVWQRDGKQEKASMSPSVEKTERGAHASQPQTTNVRKKVLNGGVQ